MRRSLRTTPHPFVRVCSWTVTLQAHCTNSNHHHNDPYSRSKQRQWDTCDALVETKLTINREGDRTYLLDAPLATELTKHQPLRQTDCYPRSQAGTPYGLFELPITLEVLASYEGPVQELFYLAPVYEQTASAIDQINRQIQTLDDWTGAASAQRDDLTAAVAQLKLITARCIIRETITGEQAELDRLTMLATLAEDRRQILGDALAPAHQPLTQQLLGEAADLLQLLA